MNIADIIILVSVIIFVVGFLSYLLVNKAKGTPVTSCSYCKSRSGNKLLKAYRKKYKNNKRCGCLMGTQFPRH